MVPLIASRSSSNRSATSTRRSLNMPVNFSSKLMAIRHGWLALQETGRGSGARSLQSTLELPRDSIKRLSPDSDGFASLLARTLARILNHLPNDVPLFVRLPPLMARHGPPRHSRYAARSRD